MIVAVFYILKSNYKNHFSKEEKADETIIVLSEEVTFLNKSGIQEMLENIQPSTKLIIDASKCKSIHYDVIELLHQFQSHGAKNKQIDFHLINFNFK